LTEAFQLANAGFKLEPADPASAHHALVVDYAVADDLGHQCEIEVAHFRIALGQDMENAIGGLDSR
jgi:hypothetical protein